MNESAELPDEVEERRCHAVLEDGSRCPNPAEAGQRYCALPDHQALADSDSDRLVAPLASADPEGMALDEAAEEAEAGAEAGAIGGAVGDPTGGRATPDPSERPVLEGGGEDAAGYEQAESTLQAAAEDAVEPDLTTEGRGFDDPDRGP
jgi:hypothetical protein